MTTNDLAAIRARAGRLLASLQNSHPLLKEHHESTLNLCDEVEALLDELAAAREALVDIATGEERLRVSADQYNLLVECQRMLSVARAYLHSATEDE